MNEKNNMVKYMPLLENTILFHGIAHEELEYLLETINPTIRKFGKQQVIIEAGRNIHELNILLEGKCIITKDDVWGNRNIVATLEPGDVMGETYALVENSVTNVSVVSETVCQVATISARKLFPETLDCAGAAKLAGNLIMLMAEKNILLNEKMTHISRRTIKEKVLSYLDSLSKKTGKAEFTIPFNRQEMADYLSVDRSALSAVLCKLRDDGLINFQGRRFHCLFADRD